MQRKDRILITARSYQKNGFAMITAIIVIVVLSTVMALSISLTTQTGKRSTDIYLYEQAVLYSKSAAELALLDIAKNGCSSNLNYTFDDANGNPMYDANISMQYIYTAPIAGCPQYFTVVTPEQNGSVLMDITLSVNSNANISNEPIVYFRRTMQKL